MPNKSIVITCKLRMILDKRGIGIREFARELDIAHTVLLGYCEGKWMPSLDLALRIGRALNLQIEEIWVVKPKGRS